MADKRGRRRGDSGASKKEAVGVPRPTPEPAAAAAQGEPRTLEGPDGKGLTAVFTCTVGGLPAPFSTALQGSSITVTTREGTRAYDALDLALSEDRYALRIPLRRPFSLRAQNGAVNSAIVLCLELLDGEGGSEGALHASAGEAIEEARP